MNVFIIVTGIFFTIFSVIVLSYVSIATTLGPWIAPTLVLLGASFAKLRFTKRSTLALHQELLLSQAIGAGGGAIATGIGFALPVLYFLDTRTFNQWLHDPFYFCMLMSMACISAGSLGIFLGRLFYSSFFSSKEELSFPVSQLTFKAATSQSRNQQAKILFSGVWVTLLIGILRDGILTFKGILPKIFYLFQGGFGSSLAFSLSPTLWSIGFTSGVGVIAPLLVGILSKYFILYPLHYQLFSFLTKEGFATAFCSGLGLAELVMGLYNNSTVLFDRFVSLFPKNSKEKFLQKKKLIATVKKIVVTHRSIAGELVFALVSSSIFFSYLNFSLLAQVVLLFFVILATYEISYIGCKIGLIPFGRFSTGFVLIPMLLIFKLNFIQITAACVFFNICAATASDLVFDYKTGSLCALDKRQLHQAQWIGLVVTSLSIGFILYLLFSSFTLGSCEFFAHRGQTKALLIQTFNFNFYVVASGFLYGLILKRFSLSPTMTLGGILMPNNITIGLLIGSICSYFIQKKDDYIPFCSGVFASESLWIIISALVKLF